MLCSFNALMKEHTSSSSSCFRLHENEANGTGQRPLRAHAGRCFLSAGAAFAFGLQSAFAWGEPSVMARLIVHDSYRQREDGTAEIFTNGAPVILQPDQYILLKGGVLLVVDEMAVAALDPRKLIQSSELNSAILTEGLYVQSSHGKLVVSQESEPIMTVRATSLLSKDLHFDRYELAQSIVESGSGSGEDAGALALAMLTGLLATRVAASTVPFDPPSATEGLTIVSTAPTSVMENSEGTFYTFEARGAAPITY